MRGPQALTRRVSALVRSHTRPRMWVNTYVIPQKGEDQSPPGISELSAAHSHCQQDGTLVLEAVISRGIWCARQSAAWESGVRGTQKRGNLVSEAVSRMGI